MQQFELVHYGEDAASSTPTREFVRGSDASAKAKAGRLSKQIKGPVDVALAGAADWQDRYLTTASPSEYHATGYRFERLA